MTTKVIGSRLTAMVSDVVQDRRILVVKKQFVSENIVIIQYQISNYVVISYISENFYISKICLI